MAAHRKLDQRRDDLCVVAPHRRVACSFFDSERHTILDVGPVDMIFVKENIVELPLIDHFSASAAFVEVSFLSFA
jgi:hypothetical protein